MPAKKKSSESSPARQTVKTGKKVETEKKATIALKIDLVETAVSNWMISKKFSLAGVAGAHGLSTRELLRHFENREELLGYYYESRWVLFKTLKEQVPDYEGYTVEEKLSNLFYTLFELMSTEKEFVRKTFSQFVLLPSGARALKPTCFTSF